MRDIKTLIGVNSIRVHRDIQELFLNSSLQTILRKREIFQTDVTLMHSLTLVSSVRGVS